MWPTYIRYLSIKLFPILCSGLQIVGIIIACILLPILAIVLAVIIFRCKRERIRESSIASINSQVMFVNNPQGTSHVLLPLGSPMVGHAQNGQTIQPAPTVHQSYVTEPGRFPANSPQYVSAAPPVYDVDTGGITDSGKLKGS